jgi:hypothetical protein
LLTLEVGFKEVNVVFTPLGNWYVPRDLCVSQKLMEALARVPINACKVL